MSAGNIQIPSQAWPGLTAFSQLSDDQLERLGQFLQRQPLTLDVAAIVAAGAKEIGTTSEGLKDILMGVLFPLAELHRRTNEAAETFVENLAEAVKEESNEEWRSDHFIGFERALHSLPRLLTGGKIVPLWYKAQQLIYNRPAVLSELRILTELRPVFDDDATTTEAMLITNTLVIELIKDGARRTIHLSMDREDLASISRELERVEKKNVQMASTCEGWDIPILG